MPKTNQLFNAKRLLRCNKHSDPFIHLIFIIFFDFRYFECRQQFKIERKHFTKSENKSKKQIRIVTRSLLLYLGWIGKKNNSMTYALWWFFCHKEKVCFQIASIDDEFGINDFYDFYFYDIENTDNSSYFSKCENSFRHMEIFMIPQNWRFLIQ